MARIKRSGVSSGSGENSNAELRPLGTGKRGPNSKFNFPFERTQGRRLAGANKAADAKLRSAIALRGLRFSRYPRFYGFAAGLHRSSDFSKAGGFPLDKLASKPIYLWSNVHLLRGRIHPFQVTQCSDWSQPP